LLSKRSSVAKLLLGVFVVYMLHTAWLLYGFLNTKPCDGGRGEPCISSYLAAKPRLQLMSVFTCLVPDNSQLTLALRVDLFDPHSTFERQVSVSLPEETQNNGSLYAVVYVHKAGVSPLEDRREVHYAAQLTTYITPPSTKESNTKRESQRPVSHWRPHLSITVMSEEFIFSKAGLPSDVRRYMRLSQEGRRMTYLPLLLVNELSCRVKDLMEINGSSMQLPLTVSYEGISLRTFRFWIHLHDILICEFLALKNDICSNNLTKHRLQMNVLWRCLGTLLIFLHLLEETSLLVLLPVGLGACVEVLAMSFKLKICFVLFPLQASRYLSYLVYPLCISGAVFSLGYIRQKK
uniref:Lipid scramblase CLPTM1L n=1 Tax=Xiphophorus maculatus TaxID=8083 RepID=A0A3B5QX12_XIPMA